MPSYEYVVFVPSSLTVNAKPSNLNESPCANVPVGAVTLVILLAARTVIFAVSVLPSPKLKVYVWSSFVALSKSVLETVYVALSVDKVPLGVPLTVTSE